MQKLAPKTFRLLVSTLLPHWCKTARPNLVSVPNFWTWTKATPQKCFYDVITFILRRHRVATFTETIKFGTIFIKTIFKYSKKRKKQKLCMKVQSISVFLDIAKIADFRWKNADVSRTEGLCHVIHIVFGSFLGKV